MVDKSINDAVYKITLMGLTGTGKTSIINRLINNSFTKNYLQTFEIRYLFKT
jgi:GTPase SAR1 family protein